MDANHKYCPMCGGRMEANHYCPTPEQIASSCEEIQRTWSASDRRKRQHRGRGGMKHLKSQDGWTPPQVKYEW